MRYGLLGTFAMLLTAATLSAQSTASGDDGRTAEVLAAVAAYDAAWNGKDVRGVAGWLDDGYRYFSSTGEVLERHQVIQFLASPQYRVDRAERSELSVRRLGATAVVSSRWKGSGSFDGGTFNDDQRCSIVLTRSDAGWRIAAEHCTQIRGSGS